MAKIIRDLDLLHPFVKQRALRVLEECKEAGLNVEVFETFRSEARQIELKESGQSKTLNSYHRLGLAVDFVFRVNNRWSWAQSNNWDLLADIVERNGFSSGWRWQKWKDGPHAELRFAGIQTKSLYRALTKYKTMSTFYTYVDSLIEADPRLRVLRSEEQVLKDTVKTVTKSLSRKIEKDFYGDGTAPEQVNLKTAPEVSKIKNKQGLTVFIQMVWQFLVTFFGRRK